MVSFHDGVKSDLKRAEWRNLCSDPALEMQRLEVGYVAAAIFQEQCQKVMDSIGHPVDAFNEAKPFRETADAWRHWGLVKAGHMHGL